LDRQNEQRHIKPFPNCQYRNLKGRFISLFPPVMRRICCRVFSLRVDRKSEVVLALSNLVARLL
jgi:hypothetical protein